MQKNGFHYTSAWCVEFLAGQESSFPSDPAKRFMTQTEKGTGCQPRTTGTMWKSRLLSAANLYYFLPTNTRLTWLYVIHSPPPIYSCLTTSEATKS